MEDIVTNRLVLRPFRESDYDNPSMNSCPRSGITNLRDTKTAPINVQVDDQILLLVTCTEKDQDRRVVAARWARDGEDEATLKKTVERSRKR